MAAWISAAIAWYCANRSTSGITGRVGRACCTAVMAPLGKGCVREPWRSLARGQPGQCTGALPSPPNAGLDRGPLCRRRGIGVAGEAIGAADEVDRACLGLFVDLGDVHAHYPERDELHPAEEGHDRQHRGPA